MSLDSQVAARRRERVMRLYADFSKNGIAQRDSTLAAFAIRHGLSDEKVRSYYHQLTQAGMLQERDIEGIPHAGPGQAWAENDKIDKEIVQK